MDCLIKNIKLFYSLFSNKECSKKSCDPTSSLNLFTTQDLGVVRDETLVTKIHDALLYSADQNQVCPTNSLVQNSSDQNQLLPQPKFLPTPVNQERLCISTYLDEIKVLETIRWGIESSGSSEFRIIPEEGIDLLWRVHQTCQEPRDLARHLPYIANSSRRRLVPPSSSRFVPLMMLNPHEIKTTSPTVIYSFPHQSSPPPPPPLAIWCMRPAPTVSLAADGSHHCSSSAAPFTITEGFFL